MNSRKSVLSLGIVFCTITASRAFAVSFTADAVHIRGDRVSHAKLFWQDGRERFEYREDGVSMVQIFDTKKNKIIWLDTKNRLYLEKKLPESEKVQAKIKHNRTYNLCNQFQHASCLHLKTTKINGREADEWLITIAIKNRDYHIFRWIDRRTKALLRQENPDGSALNVKISDNQTVNGRQVRKLDMYASTADGRQTHGIQWYDNKLGIIVKQQYKDNFVDELRNIKVGKIKQAMFVVPEGYKLYSEPVQTAQQMKEVK